MSQPRRVNVSIASALRSTRRKALNRGLYASFPVRRLTFRLGVSMPGRGAPSFIRKLAGLLRPTLPTFLILGTQKGGTTSLWDYLSRHPAVSATYNKEIHFFDLNYSRGLDWYLAHFPSSRSTPTVTGEASPYYMFHPHAPGRIANTVPDARLIVLLRNPVDRAYSHYQHNVRAGRETLSFADAIDQEPRRLQGERERLLADDRYSSDTYRHYSYLARGVYVDQLRNIHRSFTREQTLILKSEDLFSNPQACYRLALEHVGLPQVNLTEYDQLNANAYKASEPEAWRALFKYFKPHNEALYEYLGRDFEWDTNHR